MINPLGKLPPFHNVVFDDMYFETTSDFSTAPYKVKKEEHFCDKWKTDKIYCIPCAPNETYLAWHLHNRPHYQKSQFERESVEKKADAKRITFKLLNKNVEEEYGNILSYTDQTDQYKSAKVHIDQFDLNEVSDMLFSMKKKQRGVGSIARSAGRSSLHMRRKTNDDIVTPQTTKLIPLDGKYLRLMIKVFQKIYQPNLNEHPLVVDKERINKFANQLLHLCQENKMTTGSNNIPENIFEQITYGITFPGSSSVSLNCHVDQFYCFLPLFPPLLPTQKNLHSHSISRIHAKSNI